LIIVRQFEGIGVFDRRGAFDDVADSWSAQFDPLPVVFESVVGDRPRAGRRLPFDTNEGSHQRGHDQTMTDLGRRPPCLHSRRGFGRVDTLPSSSA
jgi:hypothetical protein